MPDITSIHANMHNRFFTTQIESHDVKKQKFLENFDRDEFKKEFIPRLADYEKEWHSSVSKNGELIDTKKAKDILTQIHSLYEPSLRTTLKSDPKAVKSDWEIYQEVCDSLDYMQKNYMDIYAEVTNQYQLYMKDVSSFKASLTSYMDNGTDNIKLDIPGIKKEITDIIDKWSATPILSVYSQEDADYWADQLGLTYTKNGDTYSFYVNLAPMNDLLDAVSKLKSPVSTQVFSEWQNSVNTACSTVESDTQIIAQKYSQANTVFNNLAKILSSTMDALYQTDKQFLSN